MMVKVGALLLTSRLLSLLSLSFLPCKMQMELFAAVFNEIMLRGVWDRVWHIFNVLPWEL